MEKRNLVVPSIGKALELMRAFLSSQLIETEIERDGGSDSPYFVKLAWLSRDLESDAWLGCPCFVADFHGKLPDGKPVRGVVYVKCFPSQATHITKMKIIDSYLDYQFDFIEDGDEFRMHDERGRFKDEDFLFNNGEILLLS